MNIIKEFWIVVYFGTIEMLIFDISTFQSSSVVVEIDE